MILFYASEVAGGLAHLDSEESGHCCRVLRHREGDAIEVIDGMGNLMHCTLLDADAKGATARVDSVDKGFGAHSYDLTMAVCPTKNIDRYEWFVEKATEIGVDCFVPVIGERSERKVLKTERLERIILSATKQSLKGRIPEVAAPVSVKQFIESASPDALNLVAYCLDDESLRVSIADEVRGCTRPINILIGPEGDFSPEEIRLALDKGFRPVHLGTSRLRTETAALAAVTAVYFLN